MIGHSKHNLMDLLKEWTLAKSYDINFKLRCRWKGQQGRVKIGGRRSGRTWPNNGPKHLRRRRKRGRRRILHTNVAIVP
jgi:hypothetical protein